MHPSHRDNLLLIAARKPVPGETKTRLGGAIGMERAADLYRAFLHDLAGRFMAESREYDLGWAYTPESAPFEDVIAGIRPDLDAGSVQYVCQEGDDWAERQANLLRWGAEHGYERTVLTASDSPQMSRQVVACAFRELDSADVVVGRVHDGGYYLIGVRGFHDVVTGVPMSTASAADMLIGRAEAQGLRVATVAPLFDIDIESDLALLNDLIDREPDVAPATRLANVRLGLSDHSLPSAEARSI